jgi:hypothetical protein
LSSMLSRPATGTTRIPVTVGLPAISPASSFGLLSLPGLGPRIR